MATIPIEVIVQDAESPVGPTPVDPTDSGDNTNIIVPDTGAGTVDSNSNNSFNNSSTAISIVSIVIALLAIGAVITLLVRKYNKRKKANIEAGNNTRQEKRAMAVTSTIAVLALTVLLGQLVVAGVVSPLATNAATDNKTDHIDVADKISIVVERAEDSEETVAKVTNVSYVTSTADFGYKVTVAIAADANTANLYLDGNEDSEYYIAPVSNEENGTLADNTWGYTTEEESEDCLPIPLATNPATIVKGYDNVDDEPVDIYYTVQVDKDLPAGTYIGTLEYILTDNNFPSTLTTMQGMTTEICEDTFTPGNQTTDPVPTATLRDTRDNKTYTIAKLADGNCWMTQNLDLDLDSQTALTPENTNISANWTPVNSTISFTGTTVDGWQNDNNVPYSADPGDIYYYTSGTDERDIQYNSLAECESAGHTDCSHYHAGNYYNWSAAVASNDTSSMTEQYYNAPDSICPAGWRLPKNANADSYIEENEQIAVILVYPSILGSYIPYGPVGGYYEYLENGFGYIRAMPLWLNTAGYIESTLRPERGIGAYWSSTIGGTDYAKLIDYGNHSVSPAPSDNKFYGNSIRCLAE